MRRSIEVNPSDVRSMVELGELHLRGGKPSVAVGYLERAVERGEDGARGFYLLEEALATQGPQSSRVEELITELDRFDSVEVLTRAGRLCGAAGRQDLAQRLFRDAIHNYSFTPKRMRRRERRWLVRARLGILQSR